MVMDTPDDHHVSEPRSQRGVPRGATAVFTMREAAEVAGISVSTLRRRRSELIAAGAVIEASGWQVPITALIAAGLVPGEGDHRPRSQSPAVARAESSAHPAPEQKATVRHLQSQVRELTEQVTEWRRRAEVAEARAEERGRSLESLRIANESERMALRMLTGTTSPPAESSAFATALKHPADPQPESPQRKAPPERRGGFLRRLFTD